jgi:hypothetical protein
MREPVVNGDADPAWVEALDAFEADLLEVERMLTAEERLKERPPIGLWTPPEGLGPLPDELRERAEELLERQAVMAHLVMVALATNRRHVAAASRIEVGSRGQPRPSFIDRPM